MKDFTQLNQQECSNTYKSMLKHSMQKIKSASVVANTGDYGTALSIQIVGLEEAIKAIFVYFDSLGFKFRQVKGMKALFKNHELRYFFSVIFIISDMFFKDMTVMLRKVAKHIRKNKDDFIGNEKQFLEDARASESFRIFFIKIVIPRIIIRITHILNEIEFYKQFDSLRQDGLYVDYQDKLKVPSDISEEFYSKVASKVSTVTSLLHNFIKELENNKTDYDEMIKEQVSLMKEHKGYEFFAAILTDIKTEKATALEYLESKISESKLEIVENRDKIEKTIMNFKN